MNNYEQATQEVRDAFNALCKGRVEAAVKAEREACAGLRKGVALVGKWPTKYEDGFWDALEKYEDLIRERGNT